MSMFAHVGVLTSNAPLDSHSQTEKKTSFRLLTCGYERNTTNNSSSRV